jgi:hypothetical protein
MVMAFKPAAQNSQINPQLETALESMGEPSGNDFYLVEYALRPGLFQ